MARKAKTPEAPEISVDDALRALTSDYYREIRSLAKEALQIRDEEEREAWLHETIDGHERVIYTYKARIVSICTDNPDAYEEDFGEKPAGPEQAAYASMIADVRDLLGNSYFVADNAPKGEDPEE